MATFSFTLEHIEKVIYKEYLSVEADTFEEAERLIRDDPSDYVDDEDHIDSDFIEYYWDTLECTERPEEEIPPLDISHVEGYADISD